MYSFPQFLAVLLYLLDLKKKHCFYTLYRALIFKIIQAFWPMTESILQILSVMWGFYYTVLFQNIVVGVCHSCSSESSMHSFGVAWNNLLVVVLSLGMTWSWSGRQGRGAQDLLNLRAATPSQSASLPCCSHLSQSQPHSKTESTWDIQPGLSFGPMVSEFLQRFPK